MHGLIVPVRRSSLALGLIGIFCFALTGCGSSGGERPYVVHIGNDYLYRADVDRALQHVPDGAGRQSAFDEYVDQWITTTLLAQEARSMGIDREDAVQSIIADNERAVLATAAIERMYDEDVDAPSEQQLMSYFDAASESLKLREDYVQVRYLRSQHPDSATNARRLLQRAMRGGRVDSLWRVIANRYSVDPRSSIELAETFVPESAVLLDLPEVRTALEGLRPGQIAPVVEADAAWHVLQLADLAPAGTVPQPSWIQTELNRRVTLQLRKEAYARRVQRLRTEAEGRNAIRYSDDAPSNDASSDDASVGSRTPQQ